ncbi:MAG TPA: hypothetical protein VLI70_06715, partial [Micrococcaceae bacterium]|nr:hypothetical protein [Micrococcaceae bacterium]
MSRPPSDDPAFPNDDSSGPASRGERAVSGGAKRPAGVAVAAVIVGLEAVVLLIVGIILGISLVTSAPASLASGIFLLVLVLGFGAGLAAVAVNLFRGYRWTRSAAFVWQLLMLTIAVPTLLAGQTLTGLL